MNLPFYLEMNASKFPEKVALITEDNTYDYHDINQAANKIGYGLQQAGMKRGDHIVIDMPNGYEFVVTYFGVLKLGAVVTPINTKLTTEEINYILHDSNASAFLTVGSLMEQAQGVDFKGLKVTTDSGAAGWGRLEEWLHMEDVDFSTADTKEDDLSTLLYTSGTTGSPKGVLLTNRNVLSVGQMISTEMELGTNARTLFMMPLSHSAPLNLFFVSTMMVGGTAVTRKEFDPYELLNVVETERVTHFFGAPVAFLFAAKLLTKHEFDLSSMERWVYGGAPISPKDVAFIKEQFQTDCLTGVYGLTEGGPSGTLLRPEVHDRKAGSIGKNGCLYTELKVVDEVGNDVATDEVGEIVIRGLGVMKEYHNKEDKTKETFINGWLRTGDLGKRDEDGYIWVVDRVKDVIISGGLNIYPFEVEQSLQAYPAFQEVAVVGVPHPEWGETVKVFYVGEEEVDEKDVKAFFKTKLADYKMPKLFERVDVLPRNATGKVLKHVLREEVETNAQV